MENMWNARFSGNEYFYDIEPNEQFKLFIEQYEGGTILLPGEGEGRNAVYAAKKGYSVVALDSSTEAKNKAMILASKNDVSITYHVANLFDDVLENQRFDAIALVFLHLPPDVRSLYHQHIQKLLKKGGRIFIVGFSTQQLNYNSGGPKSIDWLYTTNLLANDFNSMKILKNEQITECLNEGVGHQGEASLVVFEALKIVD